MVEYLAGLRAKQAELEKQLEAIRTLLGETRGRRKGGGMSAADRKKASQRMKAYWAKKRKLAKTMKAFRAKDRELARARELAKAKA